MIVAKNLNYSVGNKKLTDNVSLVLPDGEIVAILGPNGAGKSTLLRQLTGFLPSDSGECMLLGKSLKEWQPEALACVRAVMQQNSNMAFSFRVREIVLMGCYLSPSLKKKDNAQYIMELCDCASLAHRDYMSLSGGEQQRVQLARLLAQLWEDEPVSKWLFLDEPTSALDIHHQQHLFRLLRQLVNTRKINVCCVLHDLNLAARFADRIILMHQGQIIANGSPKEILTQQQVNTLYQADISVIDDPHCGVPFIILNP
ncbi:MULTISPECIES: heme ABC transporter ATP-binding protein [Providencia]|uniref:heme ABC transporter ATP-binding protein n=1 Tax=Providencia TaxID=586 RepID=UPI002348F5C1|nr:MULTISPECIES: heme ABC transporter ATP-binding protein [Providencia]EMB5784724.1 heme ABC transporter ATP-binding protein [Providencia rettgeri]MDK7743495.1 heme ABC transporter ATP-binding protein [Providencia rettgeri]MDK7756337.1 heme ABC transporter ATP-binding protein [Providencia rettgeri]